MQKRLIPAYLAIIFKAIIYGMSFYFTSGLLSSTDPIEVLALRFLMCAVVFTLLILFKVIKVNYKNKNIKILLCTMLFEPVGYFLFETFGLKGITTSTAGLLNCTMSAFVIVFEMLILHETTTITEKIMIFLRMLGAVLIALNTSSVGENTLWGVLFILGSVISGALFLVLCRKSSSDFTSMEITYAMSIVGAVVFNSINIIKHLSQNTITSYFAPLMEMDNLIGFIFLGIISSIIATALSNYALGKIQVSHTSAFGGLTTVVTLFAGVILLGEKLYWYHYASIVLIFIATAGMVISLNKREKQKEMEI